jgi:hypothetical protein
MARKIKDIPRKEMKAIAVEYANTPFNHSAEVFMEKYNIRESTFYNIRHKAILESMVTENVARMIQNKASANSKKHGGEYARIRTFNTYEYLLNQRKAYRLKVSEAKKIVLRYIYSDIYLETFAQNNCVDVVLLKRALRDAVVYGWISNKQVKLLEEKTRQQKGEEMEAGFQRLLRLRADYKKSKKKQ